MLQRLVDMAEKSKTNQYSIIEISEYQTWQQRKVWIDLMKNKKKKKEELKFLKMKFNSCQMISPKLINILSPNFQNVILGDKESPN